MNAVVFAGPTIAARDITAIVDAVCLPPAAQGDVYRIALERPRAIGIIDGYFEGQPSVWHKEILWAMNEGIHVFGSASMGALRAAELAAFGMAGVGAIFEDYRDGVLEDDDEVAVVHGPADTGYRPGSDAMVNMRATLARAQAAGVIDAGLALALVRMAKGLYYADRTYARILEQAREDGASTEALDRFRRWLPSGAVNQKRDDAVAMLRAMRDLLDSNPSPKTVDFVFEESLWWHELKSSAAQIGLRDEDARVLERLARDPVAWERATTGALGWRLAAREARQDGRSLAATTLLAQAATLCERHGLADPAALERWLLENRCTRAQLDHLLESGAYASWSAVVAGDILTPTLLQYLRWTGDYVRLLGEAGDAERD
jgi:hypothetical protein